MYSGTLGRRPNMPDTSRVTKSHGLPSAGQGIPGKQNRRSSTGHASRTLPNGPDDLFAPNSRGPMLKLKGVGMRGDWPAMPFALQLLEQYWKGKTIEQLSRETGIPADRVGMRLNAAELYLQRLSESGGTDTALSEKGRDHSFRLGLVTAQG